MIKAEALEKFINSTEYQDIISITSTQSRKRHEELVEFNAPYPITQQKLESTLAARQTDDKLEV